MSEFACSPANEMTQLPLFQWFFGPVWVDDANWFRTLKMGYHYEFKYICANRWCVPFRLEDGSRKDVLLKPVMTEDLDLCAWEFAEFRIPPPPAPYVPPTPCPTCGLT